MLQQYNSIKSSHEDAILLFRLGDFYEAFYKDAEILSRTLGITLTGRGKGDSRIPMAGIPHHALDNYLPQLVEQKLKIAIAEQTTEPSAGKLVEREVVRVITPGTFTDETVLDRGKNHFIAALLILKNKFSIAFADITTGEFNTCSFVNKEALFEYVEKLSPLEVLISKDIKLVNLKVNFAIEYIEGSDYELERATRTLLQHLRVTSLKGFGFSSDDFEIIPAGILLEYLKNTQKTDLEHVRAPKKIENTHYMNLDNSTIVNLELLRGNSNPKDSLFGVLDSCKTSMGKRLLYSWIFNPVIKTEIIEKRHDQVESFIKNSQILNDSRSLLKDILDIPRILGKIGNNRINGRDLLALRSSLSVSKELFGVLSSMPKDVLNHLGDLDPQKYIAVSTQITESIDDECPGNFDHGDVIKDGFNKEVDELRILRREGSKFLENLQVRERERSGISSLKVKFNKVFGYYIEVSKANIAKVPEDYVRKQTLVNAERYITEELKEYEDKILSAKDKLIQLERSLFDEIVSEIASYIPTLQILSDAIAYIDVISNFAFVSEEFNYVRPSFGKTIEITKGRHPVIERILREEYIPNDLSMIEKENVIILTGPNMSGKSTYIRQIAIIGIMAQIGCFVPAKECKIKVFDRIFSRVGASDNLSQGESTFMVEMIESANILNNATKDSLIILDEVGRGTSTYDGVAIAWSIVEYINKEIKGNTLFATHYHELTTLEGRYDGIKNLHVAVDENKGKISFTHRIESGPTDKSYGVHVADLAGVPKSVTKRANEILGTFEKKKASVKKSKNSPSKPQSLQIELL